MGWTKDRDMLLIRLCSEGASIHAIAKALETSKSAVNTRLSRLRSCGFRIPKPQNAITLANANSQHVAGGVGRKIHQVERAGERADAVMPMPPDGDGVATALPASSDPGRPLRMPFGGPIAFVALKADQCRYPLWPDRENLPITSKMVCGAPTVSGTSWCPTCLMNVLKNGVESEMTAR